MFTCYLKNKGLREIRGNLFQFDLESRFSGLGFFLLLAAMQISVINASLTNGPIVHKTYFQLYSELPHENTNLVLVMLRVSPAEGVWN